MAPLKAASQAASQIQKLEVTKGILISKLARFNEFVRSYNESQLDVLKRKLNRAESWLEEFEKLYTSLVPFISEESSQVLAAELAEFEENLDASICEAQRFIPSPKFTSTPTDGFSHVERNTSTVNEARIEARIKLPTLNLPRFDGNYEGWTEFLDSFDGIVNSNASLTPSQKLQYLKSSVQEEAAKTIQSLKVSDANYEVAWTILRKRYEQKNLIIKGHLREIVDLQRMSKESASHLRTIADTITKSTRGLEAIEISTHNWDLWLVFLVTEKFDEITLREWELTVRSDVVPTWQQLNDFLDKRCGLLEALQRKSTNNQQRGNSPRKIGLATTQVSCRICNKDHVLSKCPTWHTMTAEAKTETAKKLKLCFRCLNPWKFRHRCNSVCSKCSSPHHVVFHVEPPIKYAQPESTQVALTAHDYSDQVLLSTVEVLAKDSAGRYEIIRALLDSGSQTSFITRELAKKLHLETTDSHTTVLGLNNVNCNSLQLCMLEVKSRLSAFSVNVVCAVLDNICGQLPSRNFNPLNWKIPRGVVLADPNFRQPGRIDMLIGADHFWTILSPGMHRLGLNLPILQNTRFGYVVSGPLGITERAAEVNCNFSASLDIQEQLEKFWTEEECSDERKLSPQEMLCEKHFKATTSRDEVGRFIVSIAFKGDVCKLGESRTQAERRFLILERKLMKDATLRQAYRTFMLEYEDLGHMQKVDSSRDAPGLTTYYAPHHGVLKAESTTTKLRVVFDCSAKSSSGLSLNDLQLVGPTIQEELLLIVLRFRRHAFVVTADIAKMYRQVLIAPDQRPLQRILWRSRPEEPISTFQLVTVTYGTAAAAFLAIRCLHALAKECEDKSPEIATMLKTDFYVDDLLSGGDDREELLRRCKGLKTVLSSGGFDLRKWNSNDKCLLEELAQESRRIELLELGEQQSGKTLGLVWSPYSDTLKYQINTYDGAPKVTKRIVLSRVSRIFDPLGLLSPCTIVAKIMLQRLWMEKISWDDVLPPRLLVDWNLFEEELSELNAIEVQRRVVIEQHMQMNIHGFSDASESAFGACVYLHSTNASGYSIVQLLCAKSRVAPVKTVTVPRLELCGAVLLIRLIKKVLGSWKTRIDSVTLWTDSTIVLSWINIAPVQLKTYVGNRVAEIQSLQCSHVWRHVPTKHNPADLISRGVYPSKLKEADLWWHGPEWLKRDVSIWPPFLALSNNAPELRVQTQSFLSYEALESFLFTRYSNYGKLKRVFAYILRFVGNCSASPGKCVIGTLSKMELKKAHVRLVQCAQRESFSEELASLSISKEVKKSSKLAGLNPFLDALGTIRVGGRLSSGTMPEEVKHPAVLCCKHQLTKLIFEAEHKRLFHAGPQLLLASVRQSIWPIAGRNLAKKTVKACIRCFKIKPTSVNQLMGDLPVQRIGAHFPFQNVGVDYAGPILIKHKKGRGAKCTKHYICLFVCLAIKAVHLELVSELTTEAFMSALRRFVARRGKPSKLFSDNGTNFVGAHAEFTQLASFINSEGNTISEAAANEGIDWQFIPARSPHHGGLWERNVRSVKHHLRRITGNSVFTYEEYLTLLVQVEGILNSRPLCPLSSDPNDLEPLTPSHFLVGRVLTTVPEEDITDTKVSRLSRFQLIQYVLQHFWNRWSIEYLPELQLRSKWKSRKVDLVQGDLVLLREENLPPTRWKLGRVCETHPGKDAIVRIVSVKTTSGIVKRATSKLCRLPINEDQHEAVEALVHSTGEYVQEQKRALPSSRLSQIRC